MSSLFTAKSPEVCAREIDAASEFVERVFKAPMNLAKLQDQLERLIEDKVTDYYHQRFKDWSVADLLQLQQAIQARLANEERVKRRGRPRAEQSSQELTNDCSLPA